MNIYPFSIPQILKEDSPTDAPVGLNITSTRIFHPSILVIVRSAISMLDRCSQAGVLAAMYLMYCFSYYCTHTTVKSTYPVVTYCTRI